MVIDVGGGPVKEEYGKDHSADEADMVALHMLNQDNSSSSVANQHPPPPPYSAFNHHQTMMPYYNPVPMHYEEHLHNPREGELKPQVPNYRNEVYLIN